MNFEFIFPMSQLPLWLGAALTALAIIALALRALERRRGRRMERFVEAKLAPRLLMGFDASMRRPMYWLTIFGFAFLALALAQPHWGQSWQQIRQHSRDIMVVLDTSESMRAANPLPNRMARAKQKIESLLDVAPGDRFGLVAFSGAAELQCPLTRDHGYFKSVLSAVDTDTLSLEGTDIASALDMAARVFEEEAEETGIYDRNTRAVLLISDGEAVAGNAVKQAEETAKFARVYVIGVGDPRGAEVEFPDWMKRYVNRQDIDEPHVSRLDEENLQKIALNGDGAYKRSTPDNSDVNDIHGLLQQLASVESESDLRFRLVNRYQWPLAAAIICFFLEGVWLAALPWARRRRMREYTKLHGGEQHA